MRTLIRAAALAAAASALALAPPEARACSVCLAGDPVFSGQGATAQEQGDVSIYFEARGWRKSAGALPHEEEGGHAEEMHEHGHDHAEHGHEMGHDEDDATERTRSQRLDLYVAWTPLDRLTLTLDVPYAFNKIKEEEEGGGETRSTLTGLGDVSLAGSVVLWRNRDVLPDTWIEARAMLKTPTGRDDRKVDGRRDPHLQTGTGSWDFGFGLAGTHRRAWGSFYGSVFWRENTEGALDYEYGDNLLANLGVEVPLGHAFPGSGLDWLTPGFELNFRYAGYDQQAGERYRHSGGSILYATPSVRIRLPFKIGEKSPSLRAAVQIPTTQDWLHGDQHEREVWSLGIFLPL
jgi:hypothetical protein